MLKITREDWLGLKAKITIVNESNQCFVTDKELEVFEVETNMKLPEQYKDFLRVFGTGEFALGIGIIQPYLRLSSAILSNYKVALNGVILDSEHYTQTHFTSKMSLLENSLVVGLGDPASLVLLDLRSYITSDDSYQIFYTDLNTPFAYCIGSSFFDFIKDFCLGYQIFDFPEDIWVDQEEVRAEFTPVSFRNTSSYWGYTLIDD